MCIRDRCNNCRAARSPPPVSSDARERRTLTGALRCFGHTPRGNETLEELRALLAQLQAQHVADRVSQQE
eukprot:3067846-Alexandrium_andersonii.AAC.1